MEGASLVSKALLSSAKGSEILSSFWHNIGCQLEYDTPNILATNFHVKVDCNI